MKFRINFLFVIIASVLCLCSNAKAEIKPCPEGCFCLNGGNFNTEPGAYNINEKDCKIPASKYWSGGNNSGRISCGVLISDNHNYNPGGVSYYMDDFSEFYEGKYGFYGFMKDNNEFIYNGDCYGRAENIFQCPKPYPNSARGSKALTDCFKYDEKGQKEYYKAPTNTQTSNSGSCDIASLQALVENLQVSLNKVSQDLQNALDKAGQNKAITASANIGSLSKATGKAVQTGKGMRSGSTRSSNVDVDAAKAAISAGI